MSLRLEIVTANTNSEVLVWRYNNSGWITGAQASPTLSVSGRISRTSVYLLSYYFLIFLEMDVEPVIPPQPWYTYFDWTTPPPYRFKHLISVRSNLSLSTNPAAPLSGRLFFVTLSTNSLINLPLSPFPDRQHHPHPSTPHHSSHGPLHLSKNSASIPILRRNIVRR